MVAMQLVSLPTCVLAEVTVCLNNSHPQHSQHTHAPQHHRPPFLPATFTNTPTHAPAQTHPP